MKPFGMTVEMEVLRDEPHTSDQAIATNRKQANANVKLGLLRMCKLVNLLPKTL